MLPLGIIFFCILYGFVIKKGLDTDRPALVIWPIIIAFIYLIIALGSCSK